MTENLKGRTRRRRHEAVKRQLVEEFRQRNTSAAEFAKRHRVAVSTLHRWARSEGHQRSATRQAPGFQEVSVTPMLGVAWAGEVRLPNGTQLRWSGAAGFSGVERLVSHLCRPC